MIKTLAKSLREYKRESILSPLLVSGEVIMEVIIPFLMAKLIDHMGERSIQPVVYYGVWLLVISFYLPVFRSSCCGRVFKGFLRAGEEPAAGHL